MLFHEKQIISRCVSRLRPKKVLLLHTFSSGLADDSGTGGSCLSKGLQTKGLGFTVFDQCDDQFENARLIPPFAARDRLFRRARLLTELSVTHHAHDGEKAVKAIRPKPSSNGFRPGILLARPAPVLQPGYGLQWRW